MHVQIVTFTLDGLDHDGYRAACAQMTQAFAELPGLRAKIWLSEPATGTYGGVYLWDDRASMEAYAASELFATVASSPAFAGIVSRDFEVLEDLTLRTQPGLDVLAEPAASV
jgi:putative monooxygenase ydhR